MPSVNGAHLLARLLESLERQTVAHHVVVVDNASTDETASLLAERFPHARRVALPANVGFGRAINRGVAESDGGKLVFLNNDVECEPTFIEELVSALAPSNGIVMAAGVLLQADDPGRIDTAGIEFDPTLLAFDYLHGERVSSLANGVPDPLGPCAGAAAFDRAAFESVEGFDENFFAYLEDVDLVVRLLAEGGRCRLAREARAIHRHSATLGPRSGRKNELIGWGRGYMIGKYRLHRSPPLLGRALAGEAVAALGKLVVDRNAIGVRARLAGWQAGRRSGGRPLPPLPPQVREISFLEAQRRRIRRRLPRT